MADGSSQKHRSGLPADEKGHFMRVDRPRVCRRPVRRVNRCSGISTERSGRRLQTATDHQEPSRDEDSRQN
jgi:hypothetical protein